MMKPFDPKTIKTIGVFVEKDLIGEGLLKLPFLHSLRHAFPKAHITWIVGIGKSPYASSLKPLVEKLLDQVIEDVFPQKMQWKDLFRRNSSISSFDMILNTENNLKKTFILKKIPHRYFICALHNFLYSSLNPKNTKYKQANHLTEKLLNLVDVAAQKSIKRTFPPIDIPLSISEEVAPIFDSKQKYIAFVPGAGDRRKCWPLKNFIALASFVDTQGFKPVWILGPQEADMYEELSHLRQSDIFPLQKIPSFLKSPLYTIACAKHFSVCVSNDSGAGHLLAAGGACMISLFGHTKAEKVHPYTSLVHLIKSRDFGSPLIEKIPIDAVVSKLYKLSLCDSLR